MNGDVLTDVDLAEVVARHEAERASASILLTPVPNPAAYGLVETDASGRVLRFLEKPRPEQITTNNINAGIYVLETRTLELMPAGVNHSIERAFFPDLLARGDRVLGPVHRGYWIDIGTPEKYLQVHRDILHAALRGGPRRGGARRGLRPPVGAACRRRRSSTGPSTWARAAWSRPGRASGPTRCWWPTCTWAPGPACATACCGAGPRRRPGCDVEGSLLGPGVRIGRSSVLRNAVLGEGSCLSDFSRAL